MTADAPATPALDRVRREFHLPRFLDHLRFERGVSARTLDAYDHDVTRMVTFLRSVGREDPKAVTSQDLRAFVLLLKDLGLAPSSISRNISALRTYFGFLLTEQLVVADPSDRVQTPRGLRALPEVLTVPEITRLLETPDLARPLAWRDRALLEFMYASGVRVSEVIDLRLRNLSLEEEVAVVHGKGSKERLVPIGRRAVGAISLYLRETRPRIEKGGERGVSFSMPAGDR